MTFLLKKAHSYQFFLISFRLFHKDFTTPITVWYHQTDFAITQIRWCLLYFEDADIMADDEAKKVFKGAQNFGDQHARFAARICEFFAID